MDVILIEVENSGNIGAIARVMKNFMADHLILINPQCDYDCEETRKRAKHANNIIDKIKVFDSMKELNNYDYLIGSTGKLGNDYNIDRTPLTPKEMAKKASRFTSRVKAGIVFGRESMGLTNDEIKKMDFIVNIPSNNKYPILNISHAVCVILYDIYYEKNSKKMKDKFTPIGKKEKDVILEMIDSIMENMEFRKGDNQKETQKKVWKHLLGKAMLSRREAYALMGFFKKIL